MNPALPVPSPLFCLHARSGCCKQALGHALNSECGQELCTGPNHAEGSQRTVPGEKGPAWGMVQGGKGKLPAVSLQIERVMGECPATGTKGL